VPTPPQFENSPGGAVAKKRLAGTSSGAKIILKRSEARIILIPRLYGRSVSQSILEPAHPVSSSEKNSLQVSEYLFWGRYGLSFWRIGGGRRHGGPRQEFAPKVIILQWIRPKARIILKGKSEYDNIKTDSTPGICPNRSCTV
jgi:hypothetical protein